jgi:hypothetical protein
MESFWDIRITRHARIRMIERGIDREKLCQILSNPQTYFYDSWNDLYIAVGINGDAIVYAHHGRIIEVVSVLGRREFKALLSKYGLKRYKPLK